MVPLGPLRPPKTLLENLQSQNYFHKNTKVSFAFSLSLSYVYSGIFQRLQDMWCHKRLEAEAGMWVQLPSIKPDLKAIFKNVKQRHSSHWIFFVLENIVLVH